MEKRVLSYEAGMFLQMLGQPPRPPPSDRKQVFFAMHFDQAKMDLLSEQVSIFGLRPVKCGHAGHGTLDTVSSSFRPPPGRWLLFRGGRSRRAVSDCEE